jgi:Zn-dependent protease
VADHRPRPPQQQLPPGVVRLGSIAGSDVLVTPSWYLIAILIAVTLAPVVEQVRPGLGALRYVAGFAGAVILYGSVLLHEAAHVIAAKRLGYPVGPITLHFLGGATEVAAESRRPRDELVIAVVGPLTSLVIGGVALAVQLTLSPGGLLELALGCLSYANLLVGVLNLVPGLPLDGGRVMRAIVWGATHDMHRGTLVAGWIGRIAAIAVVLIPLLLPYALGRQVGIYDTFLSLLIAMFLWAGASAAMAQAHVRRRLPDLVARDLARRTLAVPGDLPLAEAVRRAQEERAGGIVTVTSTGAPVGVVNEAALLATPPERRPWIPTAAVARTLTDGLALPATLHGEALVEALGRTPAQEYLLLEDDGSIFGVLSAADVNAAFQQSGR